MHGSPTVLLNNVQSVFLQKSHNGVCEGSLKVRYFFFRDPHRRNSTTTAENSAEVSRTNLMPVFRGYWARGSVHSEQMINNNAQTHSHLRSIQKSCFWAVRQGRSPQRKHRWSPGQIEPQDSLAASSFAKYIIDHY